MKLAAYDSSKKQEIKDLFTTVFSNSEGPSEGQLIGNLAFDLVNTTDSKDLYGFVAMEREELIGSIFFSRLKFESRISAFILSPVAIHTKFQNKGIGQKLIRYGMEHLKENDVELVFTYGDSTFYAKVGFKLISEDSIKAPLTLTYPEGWLGQSLVAENIQPIAGSSSCVDALNKPEYW